MNTHYLILKNTAGVLAILVFLSGLSFLIFPNFIKRSSIFLNKWFSVRRSLKFLEISRDIDGKIYPMRKVIGTLALASSLFLFVMQTKISYSIFRYIFISFSALIFLSGLIFLLFPQLLKRWSGYVGKWFSLRMLLRPLEVIIDIEHRIYERRKIVGIVSLLSAAILAQWYIRL